MTTPRLSFFSSQVWSFPVRADKNDEEEEEEEEGEGKEKAEKEKGRREKEGKDGRVLDTSGF